MAPSLGAVAGGTLLILEGEGFLDAPLLACKIGRAILDALYVSEKRIECLVPPGGEGTVDVEVSYNRQEFANTNFEFTYVTQPQVRGETSERESER